MTHKFLDEETRQITEEQYNIIKTFSDNNSSQYGWYDSSKDRDNVKIRCGNIINVKHNRMVAEMSQHIINDVTLEPRYFLSYGFDLNEVITDTIDWKTIYENEIKSIESICDVEELEEYPVMLEVYKKAKIFLNNSF